MGYNSIADSTDPSLFV